MENQIFRQKRKNYFIKKGFQSKFILKFCLLIILACALMGGLVYFLSAKTMTTSFENLRLVGKSTADYILPALFLSSVIAVVFVSLACIAVVLFISHRIAGPLYHLERSIEQIGRGDLTVTTYLRQTDEIKVLAEALNNMVNKLKDPIAVSQDVLIELENDLNFISGRLGSNISQDKVDEILDPFYSKLQRLKDNLAYFKVAHDEKISRF